MVGKRFGMYWNSSKPQALESAALLEELLSESGCIVLTEYKLAKALGHPIGYSLSQLAEQSDVLIVFGGDGTILTVAQHASVCATPILGVNYGNVGFMSSVEPAEIREAADRLIRGEYTLENRMMLTVSGQGLPEMHALNDIVVSRATPALHMVGVDVAIGCAAPVRVQGDGIIFSTPTGSTAYSLSAGGPVVDTALACILMTPICSQSLLSRTLIISAQDKINITVPDKTRKLSVCVDGSDTFEISSGDVLTVEKSRICTQFVSLHKLNFFSAFRRKMTTL